MQHGKAGHDVHRRPGHVVVFAHADDVGVGKFIAEQGIGERPVAVIGGPARRRFLRRRRGRERIRENRERQQDQGRRSANDDVSPLYRARQRLWLAHDLSEYT